MNGEYGDKTHKNGSFGRVMTDRKEDSELLGMFYTLTWAVVVQVCSLCTKIYQAVCTSVHLSAWVILQ